MQRLVLGCNFVSKIMFTFDMQQNSTVRQRTSDGGNGNHSVSLPIILIKFKVNQMIPSSYISSLMVSIL